MRKTNHILLCLLAALLFAGCSSDEYVGAEDANGMAIDFSTDTGIITRVGGGEAAQLLGRAFTVYGIKQMPDNSTQAVFPGYRVQYTDSDAAWNYVGLINGQQQTIKFWDVSANSYVFTAYSTGNGGATVSVVSSDQSLDRVEMTGTALQLQDCYATDRTTIQSVSYGSAVQLQFKVLAAKVRVGLYEAIPGYSVKQVRFYPSGDQSPDRDAVLYGSGSFLSEGGGIYRNIRCRWKGATGI